MPSHDLLFRPIGVGDGFVVDAVLSDRVSFGSLHDFAPRIRRTEVRPICRRRAISDLLTPARCSFRISAACRAAVAGRPSRLPFCRAWAKPARVRSRRISRSNSAKTASRAGHRSTGWRGQIQRLGQRHEAHAEMLQFLEGRQQIRYRPAPAVQSPHQHYVDLSAAGGLQQFLPRFSLGRTGANLTDLHGNASSPAGRRTPAWPGSAWQRLLIVGGNAGVEARPEHFRRLPCLAKNVIGFCLCRGPFGGHLECHLTMAADDPFRPGRTHHTSAREAVTRDNSRASTTPGWQPVPGDAAVARSGNRTS